MTRERGVAGGGSGWLLQLGGTHSRIGQERPRLVGMSRMGLLPISHTSRISEQSEYSLVADGVGHHALGGADSARERWVSVSGSVPRLKVQESTPHRRDF